MGSSASRVARTARKNPRPVESANHPDFSKRPVEDNINSKGTFIRISMASSRSQRSEGIEKLQEPRICRGINHAISWKATLRNRLTLREDDDRLTTEGAIDGRRPVGDVQTFFGMLKTYPENDERRREWSPELLSAKWNVPKETVESLIKYFNIYETSGSSKNGLYGTWAQNFGSQAANSDLARLKRQLSDQRKPAVQRDIETNKRLEDL